MKSTLGENVAKGLGILAIAATLGCSSDTRKIESNLHQNNQDSERTIDERLAATNQLRTQVEILRNAFEPLKRILNEVGKIADLTVNGKPGHKIQTYMGIIQETLDGVTEGIVEDYPDGNGWYLEKVFNRGKLTEHLACDAVAVKVDGRRNGDVEEINFYVKACDVDNEYINVLWINTDKNGTVTAGYRPDQLIQLIPNTLEYQIQSVHCEFELSPEELGTSSFSCDDSFYLRDKNYLLELNVKRVEFRNDLKDLRADVRANYVASNEDQFAWIVIDNLLEGGPIRPKIEVCTSRKACGFEPLSIEIESASESSED